MVVSITPQELHERLETNETTILDVRASADFDDWHIQHQNAKMLNIQTSKLRQYGPETYSEIVKDTEIVVICAKGSSSQEAAQMLDEHGYKVLNVEGGMQSWSEFYYSVPVTTPDEEDLELLQIIRPAKGCLSYMLVSDGEAIVVDTGRHIDYYSDLANEKEVDVKHVLDTHCHADHISGSLALANRVDAEYWISESEMQGSDVQFNSLRDGTIFTFGKSTLEVISIPTPGHTPGSVSFLINHKYLLSGDTVFVSGIGRPDLGGKAREWSQLLYKTVRDKLSSIPDEVLILPGHYGDISEFTSAGYVGNVFEEIRSSNKFLQDMPEQDFTDKMVQNAGETPPNYTTIVQINRGEYVPSQKEASELEIGPNRCAVKHLAG